MAQMVKNLPAVQESWVPSLGREDPLEEETATHSSVLAWRSPRAEKPGRLQSMGLQELHVTDRLSHTRNNAHGLKRNESGSYGVMWMNLESVIQSAVSQNKYCMLLHIRRV